MLFAPRHPGTCPVDSCCTAPARYHLCTCRFRIRCRPQRITDSSHRGKTRMQRHLCRSDICLPDTVHTLPWRNLVGTCRLGTVHTRRQKNSWRCRTAQLCMQCILSDLGRADAYPGGTRCRSFARRHLDTCHLDTAGTARLTSSRFRQIALTRMCHRAFALFGAGVFLAGTCYIGRRCARGCTCLLGIWCTPHRMSSLHCRSAQQHTKDTRSDPRQAGAVQLGIPCRRLGRHQTVVGICLLDTARNQKHTLQQQLAPRRCTAAASPARPKVVTRYASQHPGYSAQIRVRTSIQSCSRNSFPTP